MSASALAGEPWLTIGRGAVTYTQDEAEKSLAGYAFGTTRLEWSSTVTPAADRPLAAAPRTTTRSKWAYRTYDCAPSSPHAFGVNDLLAIAALDAGARSAAYLAVEAILPDLNDALSHLDVAQTFWDLPRDHLRTAIPPGDSPSWWLWRSWAILMGLQDVGVAMTYKVLHHKRPWLFPIFDNDTIAAMGGNLAWQILHEELSSQEDRFTYLEQWFVTEATNRGGVHLTRLRIHDILLWGSITDSGNQREVLIQSGRDVLQ